MKIFYQIFLISLLSVGAASISFAQTTPSATAFLTWHATTYAPLKYEGKTLITTGSKISFSVEVVSNNQIVSLKDKVVRWYEQGYLSKSGLGMQTFETQAKILAGNDLKIRVEVPDLPGGSVSKTITLKVVKPKVVIEAPFPNLQVSLKDFFVRATPYFFSALTENSLNYRWLVNDQALSGGGDPQSVSVSAKAISQSRDRSFSFKVTAQNPALFVDKSEGQKTVVVQ